MAVAPPRTHGHHSTPRSPHQAASHAPPQLLQPRRRLRHPHHPLASAGHSTPPTPPHHIAGPSIPSIPSIPGQAPTRHPARHRQAQATPPVRGPRGPRLPPHSAVCVYTTPHWAHTRGVAPRGPADRIRGGTMQGQILGVRGGGGAKPRNSSKFPAIPNPGPTHDPPQPLSSSLPVRVGFRPFSKG